jgi:uncharacterized membrane protein
MTVFRMQKSTALVDFLILFAGCIYHGLHYYPILPENVPSNFSASGVPHGWMEKTDFLVLYFAVVSLVPLFFPGLALVLPKIPHSLISLPNRDYWLSPERGKETFDFIITSMTWLGSATLLFVMRVFHACYEAALGSAAKPGPLIPGPGVSGLLYGLIMLVFCVVLYMRFGKTES